MDKDEVERRGAGSSGSGGGGGGEKRWKKSGAEITLSAPLCFGTGIRYPDNERDQINRARVFCIPSLRAQITKSAVKLMATPARMSKLNS